MNNPFSVRVAPEYSEDELDLHYAPLIDYPAMRPGQAVATLGRKMQAYVAEGADPRVITVVSTHSPQRSRHDSEFIETPALPGYVTRQDEPSKTGGFLLVPAVGAYTVAADELRAIFELLAEFWIQQTEHESALLKIFTHRAYQQILRMGEPVTPFLLERLPHEPERWAPALSAVTHADPVPSGASAEDAVEAWRRWARSRGYLVSE